MSNVIEITWGNSDLLFVDASEYDYNYGMMLHLNDGIESGVAYQMHFANQPSGESVNAVVSADGDVSIPDSVWNNSADTIFGYLFVVGDGYGYTDKQLRISKTGRPELPDGEEPTPQEQSIIDQTLARLAEAETACESAQQAIEDMTVSAETLAEGSSATVTKTTQDGVVNLAFGIPKGEKGDTGGISETAIDLLEQAGNYIPFLSGGVDVWEDLIAELRGVPVVYHSIAFSGEHYTANNDATTIRNGRAYECIITPSEGYEITALTVTMGETSIIPTESGGSYTISIASVTDAISINVTAEEIPEDLIDICLFAGQSNMDGRGDASEATAVTTGLAYKWNSSTNQTEAFSAEPSLIPAYMQEYTSQTGVPLVEVKEAIGGTNIEQYINNYLPTAVSMLTNCLAYLPTIGKTVRRVFMLWNQGENDTTDTGLTSLTAEQYEAFFATLKSTVMQAGVEQIFVINIGQTNDDSADFSNIRTALQNVCNGTDVIMVSDKFYNATAYMNSQWHYSQVVYNVVGENSAENTIKFFNGETITIKHFDSSDIYGVPTEYGTVADWTYELVNSKVLLKAYTGSSGAVRVYHQYLIDGYYYEARIMSSAGSAYDACFTNNTTITSVTIDDGVRMMNPIGYSDANNQQSFSKMWSGCTNLQSVTLNNTDLTIIYIGNMFNGCTNLTSYNFESQISTSLSDTTSAFAGTAITSIGDITASYSIQNTFKNCASLASAGDMLGNYAIANDLFAGCTSLASVGTIASTRITTIHRMFMGCTSLAGVVRFEATGITGCSNAFLSCDLTQITIQCPANSTTYTTLSTAYPSANIVTF